MKVKQLLKKTLLVAAGLCVGANASWADEVTETYTFKVDGSSDKTNYSLTLGESFTNPSVSGITMNYVLSDANNRVQYAKRLAVSTKHSWTERPYSGFSYTEAGGNRDEYFSLCNLQNGDKFIVNFGATSGVVFKSANATYLVEETPTSVTADGTLTSGVEYTVVAGSGEKVTVDFYGSRLITLYSITIKTPEPTVLEPSIAAAAGVGYTSLTITDGSLRGNGSATVKTKYSYVSAADVKSNGALYTEVLRPTTGGTIYAYSYIEGCDESDVVSLEYEVETPKLNNPTADFTQLSEMSGSYYRQYELDTDVSNIDGDVTVAYKYSSDKSVWNDIDGTSFICPAGTYYIKATADYCEDSEVITVSSNEYKLTSSYDFTSASTFSSYVAGYTSVNGVSFEQTPSRNTYGLYYGSTGNVSIVNAINGQYLYAYRLSSFTNMSYSTNWIECTSGTLNYSLTRASSNNNYHRLQRFAVYTPVSLVATASNITIAENTDLSGMVLTHANVAGIKSALTSVVKTITLGQIANDVTEADLTSLTSGLNTNSVFVQLQDNSWYEGRSTANVRDNDGNVVNYALTDANDYAAANAFTATAATYDRSFTKDVVSTICLPFAIDAETAATLGKFYQLKSTTTTSNVVFEEVDATDALKPYLFVPAATGTITIPAGTEFVAADDVTTQTYNNVTFHGSIAGSAINSTIYGFASSGKLVTASDGTMNPFRAYLATSGSAQGIRLAHYSLNDDATGINQVENEVLNVEGHIYNLQGLQISVPTKGLYIVNGKKIIIK